MKHPLNPVFTRLRGGLLTLAALLLAPSTHAATVNVAIDETHQKIEGFGASIIDWSGRMIPLYSEPEFIDFVVDDLGLTIYRMGLVANTITNQPSDWHDITYENFAWNRANISINFAAAIRRRNPEIKIIASIWSPPAWMKQNNSTTGTQAGFLLDPNRTFDDGNTLRDDRYEHYAKFLVEYQKYLITRGVGLYAFGAQNEPMFTQQFDSCMLSGEQYARLIKTLGQMYESEGMEKPLFYGPEDMTLASYNPEGTSMDDTRHNGYVEALMADDVAPYFDVWATHGYSDGVTAGDKLDAGKYWSRIKQFGRPYWITEGGTGEHAWPTPIMDGVGGQLHYALSEGNVSAFVAWQITDAEANIHGLMDMRTPTKKTYTAMHYWRFVRPGAVRVSAEPSDGDIRITAFRDPRTHQIIVVAINPTESEQPLDLALNGGHPVPSFDAWRTSETLNCEPVGSITVEGGEASDTLPPLSITTYIGSEEGWRQDASLGAVHDFGGGWVWQNTLGWIHLDAAPWIYTLGFGWQYVHSGSDARGLYLWDLERGWLYACREYGPRVFAYESGRWLGTHG